MIPSDPVLTSQCNNVMKKKGSEVDHPSQNQVIFPEL